MMKIVQIINFVNVLYFFCSARILLVTLMNDCSAFGRAVFVKRGKIQLNNSKAENIAMFLRSIALIFVHFAEYSFLLIPLCVI